MSDFYVCPQCGPDPRGAAAHAQDMHTWDPGVPRHDDNDPPNVRRWDLGSDFQELPPAYLLPAALEFITSDRVPPQGAINVYACKTCDGSIVTRDTDRGVTPAFLRCRLCPGTMASCWYGQATTREPSHEWYRPDIGEYLQQSQAAREHLEQGGLLLREVQP